MKKIIPLTLGIVLSTSAMAQTDKRYDCDAYEVKGYILQNTVNLSMPTSITKPRQFTEALIQTKQEAGEEEGECFNIWSGFTHLSEDWKELVDKLKEIDFSFDFSIFGGFDLNALLNELGEQFDSAMESVMEELDKGICERLGDLGLENLGDEIGGYAVGKLSEKYRIDLTSDTWYNEAMRRSLNSEMRDLGNYVFDSEELREDINFETRRKVRQIEDDFWNDI